MSGGMRGFLPSSMLDWPGRLAAVIFIGGCNLRCPFCHNHRLVREDSALPKIAWEELKKNLEKKRGWLDGACVTGGEPTLWEGLPGLLRSLRGMGLLTKLDTNGTRPAVLRSLVGEGLVDSVSLDLKSSPRKYRMATGNGTSFDVVGESLDLLLGSPIELELRCTVVPGLVELEDLLELTTLLKGRAGLTLQQFRPHDVLDPGFRDLPPYEDEVLGEWAAALGEFVPVTLKGLKAQVPQEMRESVR